MNCLREVILWVRKPSYQFARFLTVGAIGTLVDIGLFSLLHAGADVSAAAANICSYSAGIVCNFWMHRNWTYRGVSDRPAAEQALAFAAISATGLILNTLVVAGSSGWLERGLPPIWASLLAKGFATGVVFFWNYFANTYWTFRPSWKGANQ